MARDNGPELVQEVTSLARDAERAFATRADLRDWLVCTIRRRLYGSARDQHGQCSEVAAAACAVRFRRECPLSSTPSELDAVMSKLPTSQLEALLRLQASPRSA
jgi:DNA-directed RNA polymerase specialized sigma24 family protein